VATWVVVSGGARGCRTFRCSGRRRTSPGVVFPRFARLSAETGETVYVLREGDARFEHEDAPLLGHAAYSVTPSAKTSFCNPLYERLLNGTLVQRPPRQATRFRRPLRPQLWTVWRMRLSRRRWHGAREGDGYSTVTLRIGATEGRPCLELGCAWCSHVARGMWLECSWYPASQRPWAPHVCRAIKRAHGGVRPWAA
jgi:hypothetical protein